jgi:protein dithiol oxidoreductase (disulfide-forming)
MIKLSKLLQILLFTGLVLGLSVACAKNEDAGDSYDEGIDYQVLQSPVPTDVAPGKVEVVELFWYGCPHCYHFEPILNKWKQNKPEAAAFEQMPATLNPSWVIHARAFYAAQSLDVLDKFSEPLFHALHEQRRRINTEDALVRFAESQGIDGEAFRKAMNSFYTQTKIRQSREKQMRYQASGVPMIVVNGKYKVSGKLAGSYDRMLKIVDYLVAQEAAK